MHGCWIPRTEKSEYHTAMASTVPFPGEYTHENFQLSVDVLTQYTISHPKGPEIASQGIGTPGAMFGILMVVIE